MRSMKITDWLNGLSLRDAAILMVSTGIILRLVVGLFFTYPIEDNYWILASTNFTMGEGLYGVPGYYYLPVWGYVLSLITMVANFFGISYGQYYDDIGNAIRDCDVIVPSIEYSFLVRIFLTILDLLVAYLIYRIGMKITGSERKSLVMASIWFLCPLTIAISSVRLMFENLEIFLLLASMLLMMEKKPLLSGTMMGACLLSKQFGVFAALILVGYAYAQSRSIRYVLQYLAGVLLSVLLLMAPIIINGDLEASMHWLTSRVDAGTSASLFNLSIFLSPLIALITFYITYRVAKDGELDMGKVSLYMLLPTAMMFMLPGNVQYYLFLLPFMLFAFNSEFKSTYYSMSILGILSTAVFITLCSSIFIESGFPGAGLVESFAQFLSPLENFDWLYEYLKSFTGILATITVVYIIIKPRLYRETC